MISVYTSGISVVVRDAENVLAHFPNPTGRLAAWDAAIEFAHERDEVVEVIPPTLSRGSVPLKSIIMRFYPNTRAADLLDALYPGRRLQGLLDDGDLIALTDAGPRRLMQGDL